MLAEDQAGPFSKDVTSEEAGTVCRKVVLTMQTFDRIPFLHAFRESLNPHLNLPFQHPANRELQPINALTLGLIALAALGSCISLSGCAGVTANGATAAVAGPDGLSASPSSLDFGSANVGNSNNSKVTLSNSSKAPVVVSQLTVSDPSFMIDQQNQLPITIAGGASTDLMVHFKPQGQGDVYADLTVVSDVQSSTSSSEQPRSFSTGQYTTTNKVRLHGKGTTSSTSSQTTALSALSCSSGTLTGAATDTCTVTLNAAAPSSGFAVSVSSSNVAITVPASVNVPSGATTVQFTANASAVSTSQTATLTATANGVSQTYSIQLNPPSAPSVATLSINATSVSFGNVSLNTPSTQSLTLSSTGSGPVTVNSASVSGTGYSISGLTLPATINPGNSATLNVQFDPTAAGTDTGQVTISSNSSTNPNPVIALSGTGVAPHVSLTWTAPSGSSDPISGYKVYRAPSTSSSFTLLNSQTTPNLSYSDMSVQAGTTYQYYVTAVDSSGAESTPSNTASIAVP